MPTRNSMQLNSGVGFQGLSARVLRNVSFRSLAVHCKPDICMLLLTLPAIAGRFRCYLDKQYGTHAQRRHRTAQQARILIISCTVEITRTEESSSGWVERTCTSDLTSNGPLSSLGQLCERVVRVADHERYTQISVWQNQGAMLSRLPPSSLLRR